MFTLKNLEAALEVINPYGRIPVCGMIADYNAETPQPGPSNLLQINTKKLTMQGFIVMDYWDHIGEFVEQMGPWIKEGKVKSEETVLKTPLRHSSAYSKSKIEVRCWLRFNELS
ncbi:hypothetical protein [Vibrio sp. YIC-376]|uniref:hypothetical protein n=1 Tax=Vibrio sp. YIC-376 TaxID=3136162 RepID=UPI00402AF96F